MRLFALLLFCTLFARPATGQFKESFSDGDIARNPVWTGDGSKWRVVPFGSDFALQAFGGEKSDTLTLATPSRVSIGSWSWTFVYTDVNLSNFSGARVYLMADTPDLTGALDGYFVQFGTNNGDEVRFYRQDGTVRTELGRTDAILTESSGRLDVRVTRSADGRWSIGVNGITLASALDNRHTASAWFGIWIKHTASSSTAFLFDNIDVQGTAGPEDALRPRLISATESAEGSARLIFSRALDTAYLSSGNVLVNGRPAEALHIDAADGISLSLVNDPPARETELSLSGLRGMNGQAMRDTVCAVARFARRGDVVLNEIMYEPLQDAFDGRPDQVEYLEFVSRTPYTLSLDSLRITEAPNERGEADTLVLAGARVVLPAGGRILAFAGADRDGPFGREITDAFPSATLDGGDVVLLPQYRSSLSLGNDGRLVRVIGPGDVVLDEVAYDPAWHHPALAATRGISLERISAHGRSDDPDNWSSSPHPDGGTPGRANALTIAPAVEARSAVAEVHPRVFSPDFDGQDDVAEIQIHSTAPNESVRVRIFDDSGHLVRTLAEGGPLPTNAVLPWNGRDEDGRDLRIGIYIVLVDIVSADQGRTEMLKLPLVLARRL